MQKATNVAQIVYFPAIEALIILTGVLLKVLNSEGSVGNMNFVESALRRAQILTISKFGPTEFTVLNRV